MKLFLQQSQPQPSLLLSNDPILYFFLQSTQTLSDSFMTAVSQNEHTLVTI
jgi:hypothetical protein